MTARSNRLAGLILLVFAIYTIAAAHAMSYMQGRTPGPGFAPFWIGLGLAAAALVILVRRDPARTGRGQPAAEESARGHAWTMLVIAALTVISVALIDRLGMIAALALLLLGLTRILGGSWRTAGLTAIALPLGLYVLFGRWLQVPLPRGPWGF